jgi:sec-independent protein translocase protein TatA
MEWLVILILGLLIFGRRLPDVARSLGKSITEFKKGMKDVQDDIHHSIDRDEPRTARLDRSHEAAISRPDKTSSERP